MTNKIRTKAVVIIVILQMAFFAGWYAIESGILKTPITKIMVRTQPYDPRDLLSGQYISLNYSFSTINGLWNDELKRVIQPEWADGFNSYSNNKNNIWVVLHEVNGFYEPKSISYDKPINLLTREVAIKGTIRGNRIQYGIERYFVPEGTKEPNREDTTVELGIYENGTAHINQVFVNGKNWP